ncbi:glycine-rich domain-containing protein 1 [Tanacetum coccineum]
MKDDIFLEGAVEIYKGFLHMIRRNKETKSNNFYVLTYDIDLMWHTHQLHPLSYFNDSVSLLGKVLAHDDIDSDRTKGGNLDVGFSTTTKQWKEMFSSSRCWRAGAMYRDVAPVQGQSHHSNLNQSSNIMFMESINENLDLES